MNRQQEHLVRVAKDSIERLANTIEYLQAENEKLRKALDKACEMLESSYGYNDKEEWKESLMNDE